MGQMSNKRLELHEELCTLLGSRNVYFQPPESVKMSYPAIRYELSTINNWHADNAPYLRGVAYRIYLISRDPDSELTDALSKWPKCRWERHFVADNLNHDVFVLYK